MSVAGPDILRLMTIRSDDQFNTSIYTLNDRSRDIKGGRKVLLMNTQNVARLGFPPGDLVTATTVCSDNVRRSVSVLRIIGYDIPQGCLAGYSRSAIR